jgi:hypothetical protein
LLSVKEPKARSKLDKSSDEDAPVDESSASIPSGDGGAQGSQTLVGESSQTLDESQNDSRMLSKFFFIHILFKFVDSFLDIHIKFLRCVS